MSGLCGWIGQGRASTDPRQLAAMMAAPLTRSLGAAPVLQVTAGAASALAGAGVQCYQDGGLQIMLWGAAQLAGCPDSAGPGSEWATLWRTGGAQALCGALSGAFALAVIDEPAGEALLVTDHMGSFPLLYQQSGETLVFASSAQVLRRHPLTPPDIDPQGLYNYVFFHMIPAPGGVYRHQQRLLPGSYLHYRQGRLELGTYWRMRFDEQADAPFAQLKQEFLQVLRDSVRASAKVGPGGKVGAFLSGGTDSSTLAGILCQTGGVPAPTYSIGFAADGYDEMSYARLASRHFGTDHHEYYVTADDVADILPHLAQAFDQPFGNASAVPAYYCARLAAADGVTRMLGGDGGDELFGGNERYARQQIFALYQKVPALLRQGLLEPALQRFPGIDRMALLSKARSYVAQASVPMPARLETYNLLHRYGAAEVFEPAFLANANPARPLDELAAAYHQSDANSLINRMLALDLKMTLADNDLPKVRQACDLAGVEVAFPFLQQAMVAFSARLRPRQKLNGRQLRYFFKQALGDFLPQEIIHKQKHGFGLPFGVWMQQYPRLQQLAGDSLQSLRGRGVVRGAFIDQLLGHHVREHAGYHGTMVWVLMMLEQWYQQHHD